MSGEKWGNPKFNSGCGQSERSDNSQLLCELVVPVFRLTVESAKDLPDNLRATICLLREDGRYVDVTYEEFKDAMAYIT